jgi:hypothetical protein
VPATTTLIIAGACLTQTGEWTDTLDSTKVAEPFIKEATLDEQQVRTEVWDTVGLDKHRCVVTIPSVHQSY